MTKDFYVVLQVTHNATPEEIHAAYRRRAQEVHPDKSGAGSEPFLELQEAYAVLSDPERRAAYDRASQRSIPVPRARTTAGPRRGAEPFRQAGPMNRFRDISLGQSFDTFEPSFDEVFERLWSNFDLLTRPKAERLESLTVDVPVSPDEAMAGGTVRILVPARIACPSCRGLGGLGWDLCWRCDGQGILTTERPLDVSYPAWLRRDYIVRIPLDDFGIRNFYLTVRFRLTDAP